MAVAPAALDVARVAAAVSIPVLAQHVDPAEPGPRTGWIVPETLLGAGARGSLVNHSEHPVDAAKLPATIDRLARLGLVAVACARDAGDARRVAGFRPPYLAIEPPDLIGGAVSVSTARPEVIAESVQGVAEVSPSTVVLCGAGVHDRRDVAKALELGSHGILVASAVTTAEDPAKAIEELLAGF